MTARWIESIDSRVKPPTDIGNSIHYALDAKHYEFSQTPSGEAIVWLYGELVKALDAAPRRPRR